MYVVRDREAGNVITKFETMEDAKKELERYEAQDKKDGTYTEDFYEIAVIDQIKEVHIMKVYKIYSKGCTNPNPIKDVTYMEKEMVEDAISENWDNATENGSVEFETDIDGDISQEDYESKLSKFYEELKESWEQTGILLCGDWELRRLEDDEFPQRPNNCGWEEV